MTDEVLRGNDRGAARLGPPRRLAPAPAQAGGANVNLLASSDPDDLERLAGMAFLNGIPVRLEAVLSEPEAELESREPQVA